jgi:TPP-dependent pyruvate/acetoin dehydrogenase alpha subunit
MILIRKFEEKAMDLFGKGLIPGLIHLSIGQEAVPTGICANLGIHDYILSTHRGHGDCIAKGADPGKMMAELLGKKTGYCEGRGGSMHIGVPELGILGCTGVVASGIPIAVGAGLSIQQRKTDQVAISFFGEGATNAGAFHEGLNLAAVWKLPVVFVCQNNLYMEFTPISETSAVTDIAEKASAYHIPASILDGMDVMEVYEGAKPAIERARTGGGPSFLECKTYRYRGHHEGDPKRGAGYRATQEMEEWEKKDPILRLRNSLLNVYNFGEKEVSEIDAEVEKKMDEATKFAIDSPHPSAEEVALYVLKEE